MVDASQLFGYFAAGTQLALALALFVGNPRNERVSILGSLFFFNGIAALARELGQLPLPELVTSFNWAMSSVHQVADYSTNFLLIWLALVYPRAPGWLPRKHLWWLVPLATPLLVVVLNSLPTGTLWSIRANGSVGGSQAIIGFALIEVGFPILLFRWSQIWRTEMPNALRKQFGLIFAVFALRAFYVMPLTLSSEYTRLTLGVRSLTPSAAVVFAAVGTVMIGSLIVCLVRVARRGAVNNLQNSVVTIGICLGFSQWLGFYLFEEFNGHRSWWSVWGHLDLYLVRPAIVWFAFARYGFANRILRSTAFAWSYAGVLFLSIAVNAGYGWFSPASLASHFLVWAVALLSSIALVLTIALAIRYLAPSASQHLDERLVLYSDMVAQAAADGSIAMKDKGWLAMRRHAWGVTGQQHEAILAGLRAPTKAPNGWRAGETVMERYRLEHHFPSGQGIVWKARDILSGDLAVLKAARAMAIAGTIRQEWRALARLDHPNILAPLHLDYAAGRLFLVSPFVPGGTLADPGNRSTWHKKPDDARNQLMAALRAAHNAGLTHGDVKPSNVLVDRDRLWLSDFGNTGGGTHGTPEFISPESDPNNWTPADDVASLELTLDWLIDDRSALPQPDRTQKLPSNRGKSQPV